MAYARRYSSRHPSNCSFVAQAPTAGFAPVSHRTVAALLDAIEDGWEGVSAARRKAVGAALPILAELSSRRRKAGAPPRPCRDEPAQRLPPRLAPRARPGGRHRCRSAAPAPPLFRFIHDLIPLQPSGIRPAAAGAAPPPRASPPSSAMADGVVVNSAATAAELACRARGARPSGARRSPSRRSASRLRRAPGAAGRRPRPYFVCLGTIEPRKNHLLLLHLWRHLAETLPRPRTYRACSSSAGGGRGKRAGARHAGALPGASRATSRN